MEKTKWNNESLNKAPSHTLAGLNKWLKPIGFLIKNQKYDYMHLIGEPKQNKRNKA